MGDLTRRVSRERLTVGYVVRGSNGKSHPPTAWIRVLRYTHHPEAGRRLNLVAVDPEKLVRDGTKFPYDLVLVQRDAVPGDLALPLIDQLRSSSCPLVVELDDDLVTPGAVEHLVRTGYEPARLDGLRQLLDAADLVIVSTSELARRFETHHNEVVEFPNALDPSVWTRPRAVGRRADRSPFRILYAGSATHAKDLEIVWELPSLLGTRLGHKVCLETVGVTRGDLPNGAERLPIPEPSYPAFARWLQANRARWDMAIAPLVDDDFNRAKSDLKMLEYALLGLPVVASDVGPYSPWEPFATLVENDVEAWVEACASIAGHPDAAARRARAAAAHVRRKRMITPRRVRDWTALLSTVVREREDRQPIRLEPRQGR